MDTKTDQPTGKLLVIEGTEGAGKSTMVSFLHAYLQSQSKRVLITREPGGTPMGEVVRSLVKDEQDKDPLTPMAELLLLYAARVQHLEKVIKPALSEGIWVICDRFELSTWAYQGGGRGIPLTVIQSISRSCLQDFIPDYTLFFDIPPIQGLARASQRGATDCIEKLPIEFFERVYQAYHAAIAQYPGTIEIIDASQTLVAVEQRVHHVLHQWVGHHES